MAQSAQVIAARTAPDLRAAVDDWQAWLRNERRAAANTRAAYLSDLARFLDFTSGHLGKSLTLRDLDRLRPADFRAWLAARANGGAGLGTRARGLSVVQGDADTDLGEYPAGIFDVVILSQTIQATRNPRNVLNELLRIGTHIIVSFPNFGHWRVRLELLVHGRMPVNKVLGHAWCDTPNIHLCTISDFLVLTRECGAHIERALKLDADGHTHNMRADAWSPNIFAQGAIFLLTRN